MTFFAPQYCVSATIPRAMDLGRLTELHNQEMLLYWLNFKEFTHLAIAAFIRDI